MTADKNVYVGFIDDCSKKEQIICYINLEVINEIFTPWVDSSCFKQAIRVYGTRYLGSYDEHSWFFYAHTEAADKVYLKINGKVVCYMKDILFNKVPPNVKMWLENTKTLMSIEKLPGK
jgi:hypothetical protein